MSSAAQKRKVEKVMHEYEKGDLKSSSGRKVKSRKQAVAIAMSESGQSVVRCCLKLPVLAGDQIVGQRETRVLP